MEDVAHVLVSIYDFRVKLAEVVAEVMLMLLSDDEMRFFIWRA